MKFLSLLILLLISSLSHASPSVWVDQGDGIAARAVTTTNSEDRIFSADLLTLQQLLEQAPHESTGDRSHVITLPMPDGSVSRYQVVESPIAESDPSSPNPRVKTYRVFGVDEPGSTGRIDIGPLGFHGMVFTRNGRIFIDPASDAPLTTSYASGYASKMIGSQFSCGVDHMMDRSPVAEFVELRARGALARAAGELLIYRLAVSATRAFANRITDLPGDDDVNAVIATAINRVNEIYERDLGIRLLLVGNDDTGLIEQSGDNQFTDGDAFALLSQNTTWLNEPTRLGSGEYDVGHVFASSGGGLARIGSVCQSTKAEGFSGRGAFPLTPPTNADRFFVDYVAHELGHQFGAEHSFNGTSVNCASPNRVSGSAFEPGSGSTIMGYTGICGVEDLQGSADATFHAASIGQINAYVNGGGNCSASSASIANPNGPVIEPIANKTIPKGTAFFLDASATDGDGDTLSYQWDQLDSGTATDATSFGTDLKSNALFRTFEPRSDGNTRRDFPSVDTQVRNKFDDAEVLPCRSRELNFRVTARDGRSEQGTEDVKLTVYGNAGPFRVTSFNTAETINATGPANLTVQWDVANTFRAPIACTRVDIDLLNFASDYVTYSVHNLLSDAPNDGSAAVTLMQDADRARFRITCSDNYFYDISDGDIAINGTGGGDYADSAFNSYRNGNGTVGDFAPECPALPSSSGRSSGGGGSVSWLIPLFGIVGLWRRQFRVGSASL